MHTILSFQASPFLDAEFDRVDIGGMRRLVAIGLILHFGSGRSVSADAARVGLTEKRIASTDTDPVTFPGFVTTPGCEDRCADVRDGAPGAECNSAQLAGCVCVFDDPYCFSECVDEGEGGEWLMACAGAEPPDLPDLPTTKMGKNKASKLGKTKSGKTKTHMLSYGTAHPPQP